MVYHFYKINSNRIILTFIWLMLVVLFVNGKSNTNRVGYSMSDTDSMFESSVYEDSILKTPELIHKYKYPIEVHNVITEDGYILEVHRLPNPGKQPVYGQHGLASSSAEFVFYGPKMALAYLLYDAGYDVWLGNHRGNRYSKQHVTLEENDINFWNFTLTELGEYDLKASIDYVLKISKFEKLHYIGNSQGCAVIFILCNKSPEYSDKLIGIQAMVPAVYVKNMQSPLGKFAIYLINTYKYNLPMFRGRILVNMADLGYATILNALCHDGSPTQEQCRYILSLAAGFNTKERNNTLIPVLLNHYPSGASVLQVLHFKQMHESGEFKKYDYGRRKNLRVYGQRKPPLYDIKKTKAKVRVYHSSYDSLVVNKDVENFYKQLVNPAGKVLFDDYEFNHISFIGGSHCDNLYKEYIIKSMKSLDNEI